MKKNKTKVLSCDKEMKRSHRSHRRSARKSQRKSRRSRARKSRKSQMSLNMGMNIKSGVKKAWSGLKRVYSRK